MQKTTLGLLTLVIAGIPLMAADQDRYFVEYKYRLASNTTEQLVLKDGSGSVEVENNGVSGGQVMAGLSYQF